MDMNIDANAARNPSQMALFLRALAARRRAILIVGILAITIGLFLERDWLIAAGIAPALIAFLPCAAMCALGLCMGGKKGHCSKDGQPDKDAVSSEQRSGPRK